MAIWRKMMTIMPLGFHFDQFPFTKIFEDLQYHEI